MYLRKSKSFDRNPKKISQNDKINNNPKNFLNNKKENNNNNNKRVFGKDLTNEINKTFSNFTILEQKNKIIKNVSKENKLYKKSKVNNNINVIKNKIKENFQPRINNENLNNNINITNRPNEKLTKNKKDSVSKIQLELIKSFQVEYKKNPIDEYEDAISKNLFEEENINRPDYKQISDLLEVEKNNIAIKRNSCVNLALLLCETFELRQETLYLSINIFDRYIQKITELGVPNNINTKLIMLTSVFISSKYEEIYPPLIDDYLHFLTFFSKNDVLNLENDILSKLNFELHICSPYLFLTKFFTFCEKCEKISVMHGAQFILDLCLISTEFCIFKPSFQAVICLYLAIKLFNGNKKCKNKIWPADMEFLTGYTEAEIRKNIKIPVKLIKEFFGGNINKDYIKSTFFRKFSENKFSNVAYFFKDICTAS